MMIIMGYRSRNKVMGQVQYVCPQCRQNSFHTVVRSRRWFTLYFIPLFPLSKNTSSRCNMCGIMTPFDNAEADARFGQKQVAPQVAAPMPPMPPKAPLPQEYPYPIQPQQPQS